jgi:hypothetical protein
MMKRRLRRGFRRTAAASLTLFTALLAAPVASQSLTLPSGADQTEQFGGLRFGETLPLTPTGRRLIQINYGPGELAGQPAQTWSALELRPDAVGIAHTARVRVAVWLSALGVPEPRAMSLFDRSRNRGRDRVQVVRPRVLTVHAQAARSDGLPQPAIRLSFDTPYSWPAGAGLLVEIDWERVDPWQPGVQDFDVMRTPRLDWQIENRIVGPGCVGVGSFGFTAGTGTRDEDLGLVASYSGTNIDMTANVLLAIAGPRANVPLDSFGAPGCVLGVDPALLVTPMRFAGQRGGTFWTSLTVPWDPVVLGSRVLGQAWIAKPGINALGLALSETVETRVVQAPLPRRAQVLFFEQPTGYVDHFTNHVIPVLTFR